MDEITVAWIAGVILSLIGWGSLVHFSWIVRTWPRVRGRVIGNVSEYAHSRGHEGGARSVVHFAKIEFPANGARHVARGGIGKSAPWTEGETVELHYKPSNPDHLLDLNLWQRLFFSGAFIAFGLASLAAAKGWIG